MKLNVFYSKMALFEDSVESLAKFLGISRQTLRSKLDGKSQFKQVEIDKIADRYRLTPEEIHEIFFNNIKEEK